MQKIPGAFVSRVAVCARCAERWRRGKRNKANPKEIRSQEDEGQKVQKENETHCECNDALRYESHVSSRASHPTKEKRSVRQKAYRRPTCRSKILKNQKERSESKLWGVLVMTSTVLGAGSTNFRAKNQRGKKIQNIEGKLGKKRTPNLNFSRPRHLYFRTSSPKGKGLSKQRFIHSGLDKEKTE